MAKSRKKEAVTASFHYLTRETSDNKGNITVHPFTQDEFDDLASKLISKTALDFSDEGVKERLRFRNEVPMEKVRRVSPQMVFGVYHGSYWGHSFNNTDKGEISADSVNLRSFHFLLYLSKSGKIYLGAQYLGQYGSYASLEKSIRSHLDDRQTVIPHSFRLDASHFVGAEPKEVRVNLYSNSENIAGPNIFRNRGMVSFRKTESGDGFEAGVRNRILAYLGKPSNIIKAEVAKLLNENELFDVKDSDIMDCTIVARMGNHDRVIHMIEASNYASKFEIYVPIDAKGHPEYEPTLNAMAALLANQILAKSENV